MGRISDSLIHVTLMSACALALSCDKRSSEAPEAPKPSAKGKAATPTNDPPVEPSVRGDLETWRSLLDEAARAELSVGGLLIDFGSPEQYKYTRGDWRSGWSNSELGEDSVSFAKTGSKNNKIWVELLTPAVSVAVRARSAASGQKMAVLIDGKYQGTTEIGGDWGLHEVALAEPASAGRHEITFQFAKSAPGSRGDMDFAWMRASADGDTPTPLPRVLPVGLGSPKRALPSPSPRTYSFYFDVPAKARFVFDYGSDKETNYAVRVSRDGAETKELFAAKSGDGRWHEGDVDLSEFAGHAVRLDLVTDGPPALAGWGEPEIMVPPSEPTSPAGTPAKPTNLIVILIDTVRADVFEAFDADNKILTPTYDALAKKSTVFRNAYNAENWTKPSVTTNLTGLYPVTHDTKKDPSVLPAEVTLLPQHLQKQGFKTAGFIANGFISDKFGFQKGWDAFKNYIREGKKSDAEYVYGDALKWLDENQTKPFFLYLQTIDPHVVYRVARKYTEHYYEGDYKGPLGSTITAQNQIDLGKGKLKGTEDDLAWLKAMYWGEVTYHDEHMGLFLAELEKRGLMDNTLLVVTNDHGEELGEHGRYGHGHSLYDELLRAPLLFHHPSTFAGQTRTEVVEQVDLTPTILDTMELPPMDTDGESLLPLLRGEPVGRPFFAISEFLEGKRSVRVGRHKLLTSSGNWQELYDIEADRGETENLYGKRPIGLRLCEIHLGEALAAPKKNQRRQLRRTQRKFESADADIDPKLREQLEALGYFGQ